MASSTDSEVQSIEDNFTQDQLTKAQERVYPLIQSLTTQIISKIDSVLSQNELDSQEINLHVVKPLIEKYNNDTDLAVVYSCFIARSHFLECSKENLAEEDLNRSRAIMCELLAVKLVHDFATRNKVKQGAAGINIKLAEMLTSRWSPLDGAPHTVSVAVHKQWEAEHHGDITDKPESANALEMAIFTDSKRFIASPLVYSVVYGLYSGQIEFLDIRNDFNNHKLSQVRKYDFRKVFFLDPQRWRVPKYRMILEILNLALLLLFFMLCLTTRDFHRINSFEGVFLVVSGAFALGEYVNTRAHGWHAYMANMWNVFDASFIIVWLVYVGFRIRGLFKKDDWSNDMAFGVLACGACILFPRIAFFSISRNVIILALRGMIAKFFYFTILACICFSGLLFTLWELARMESDNSKWSVSSIAWLMTQMWFGNRSLSIGEATSFHRFFGPILMISFSALANTMLVTMLTSILTHTFSHIDENANEEHLYQFALTTMDGITSRRLSHPAPFNLLTLIVTPLRIFRSNKVLVASDAFLVGVTTSPLLILISIYERFLAPDQQFRRKFTNSTHRVFNRLPRSVRNLTILEPFVGSPLEDFYRALFKVVNEQRNDEPQTGSVASIFVRRPVDSSDTSEGAIASAQKMDEALAGVHKVENMLENATVGQLSSDIKEMLERQALIEGQLSALTGSMRGDKSATHDRSGKS